MLLKDCPFVCAAIYVQGSSLSISLSLCLYWHFTVLALGPHSWATSRSSVINNRGQTVNSSPVDAINNATWQKCVCICKLVNETGVRLVKESGQDC